MGGFEPVLAIRQVQRLPISNPPSTHPYVRSRATKLSCRAVRGGTAGPVSVLSVEGKDELTESEVEERKPNIFKLSKDVLLIVYLEFL